MPEATTENLVSRINNVNGRIDALAKRHNQLIGEQTAVRNRLKDEHGVKSTAQATAKLQELEDRISSSKAELTALLESIEASVEAIENDVK